MFIFKENGPSHCKDKHVHFQRKRTFTLYMFIFTMWRSIFFENEHPFPYNVKVRFLWKWTCLSLQCEGPFSLKMNMFIFTMWRSVFSENEHVYLYNVKVWLLWKWTWLSLQFSEKTDLHIVRKRMFIFRENGPSHCKEKHVQFQRKRTFTL
jgi:hypothetical protein